MRKGNLLVSLGTIFVALCSAQCANTQRWVPKRIVGMDYPELASRARIQGRVEITCVIQSEGSVASTMAAGDPHRVLSKPAQENAMKWVFMTNSGVRHSTGTVVLIYSFKLEGKGSDHPRSHFVFEYPNSVNITSEFWNINTTGQDPTTKGNPVARMDAEAGYFAPQRAPAPRRTWPARAPVGRESETATTPLTMTYGMPAGKRCGRSYVAVSATSFGSKTTRSAA